MDTVDVERLLRELAARGIQVTLSDSYGIRIRAPRGVSLDPYREAIKSARDQLILVALKDRILEEVTVDPVDFDRGLYERLFEAWYRYSGEG